MRRNFEWPKLLTADGRGIAFGGDYNPDQWSEDIWDDDIRLMKQAGVNTVALAIFSWDRIQPTEDRWDFGWLDRIIDKLDPTGIYTAYDLVCAILDTPFEGSAESEEKTQKAISGLPYLDYEEILSKVLSKRRVRAGKKNRKKSDEAEDFTAEDQDMDDDGAATEEVSEDPDSEGADREEDGNATD